MLKRPEGVAQGLLVLPHVVTAPGFPQGKSSEAVVRKFGTYLAGNQPPTLEGIYFPSLIEYPTARAGNFFGN